MKFLKPNINTLYKINDVNYSYHIYRTQHNCFEFDFKKLKIRNRKFNNKSKLGVLNNLKRSSLIRDKNNSLLNQFINLSFKKGKKSSLLKSLNLALENILLSLNNYSDEFKNFNNYDNFILIYNKNQSFNDVSYLLFNFLLKLESIFEIKTIKNPKKFKSLGKYSHEIIYIPKLKRLKYVLRSFSLYNENFKNYNLWERFF